MFDEHFLYFFYDTSHVHFTRMEIYVHLDRRDKSLA
jgi:hypothetical protein